MGPLIPLFRTSGDVSSGFQVSKPEWVLPYSSLVGAYMLRYMFPEHGSRAVSSTYLQGIGGTQNLELSCRRSQCEIRQMLSRLSYPGSANESSLNFTHFFMVK